jgi:acyl-CoA thioesterase YciA
MRLVSTKICKTGDIGVNNNLFGGIMLAWLDEAGGTMAAEEVCSKNVVTLKMDEVLFKKAVHVNDHIKIYGKVISVGKSSISLFLDARRFCFRGSDEETVCSTKLTYVKIDEEGKSSPIKPEILKKIKTTFNLE